MGSRLAKLEFSPKENEQFETVIKVPGEARSIIHGVVMDTSGKLLKDAVVKLFEMEDPSNPCLLKAVAHTFTDECGQFLFGPLFPNKHYAIKIWVNEIKARNLVKRPEKVDNSLESIIMDTDERTEKEIGFPMIKNGEPSNKQDNQPEKAPEKESEKSILPAKTKETRVRRRITPKQSE